MTRNKTINLDSIQVDTLIKDAISIKKNTTLKNIENKIIYQDSFEALKFFPKKSVDLVILDPPYNLSKKFGSESFKKQGINEYANYLEQIIVSIIPLLKDTASIYICSDWLTSISIPMVVEKYFKIQNRITWQREKGRGSLKNWKNSHEDIWFCTLSDNYIFNVDSVKLRRKVLAPYKKDDLPKDWKDTPDGKFRDTYPSNFWDDITIPYWSMSENTIHPTQKPEKLVAKLILASSNENDVVLDMFGGSGTTAVVSKKLNRTFISIEKDPIFVATALYRLKIAEDTKQIQGFEDGVFWERNSKIAIKK